MPIHLLLATATTCDERGTRRRPDKTWYDHPWFAGSNHGQHVSNWCWCMSDHPGGLDHRGGMPVTRLLKKFESSILKFLLHLFGFVFYKIQCLTVKHKIWVKSAQSYALRLKTKLLGNFRYLVHYQTFYRFQFNINIGDHFLCYTPQMHLLSANHTAAEHRDNKRKTYKCNGDKFTSNVVDVRGKPWTTWAFPAVIRCEVGAEKVGPDKITNPLMAGCQADYPAYKYSASKPDSHQWGNWLTQTKPAKQSLK